MAMQIYRHLHPPAQPRALAIGNFDGVHRGHQAMIARLLDVSAAQNLTPALMTFEPHPREFFTPQQAPARLTSLREKLELFADLGVAETFICRFNTQFSALNAQHYLQILRNDLQVNSVLVGEDFRFGAQRSGNNQSIRDAGFNLHLLPAVSWQGERVSSTLIRQSLAQGDLPHAAQLLGRAYSISGNVVHGAKRGRQLGFPTANIHMKHERPALTGVYAVKLDGLNAVANLGVRPTIKNGIAGVPKLSLEVHVLDFNGDLYGQHVHVQFLHKLRDEQKFDGLAALTAQITKDVAAAKAFFAA